jgi:hypothetical protein
MLAQGGAMPAIPIPATNGGEGECLAAQLDHGARRVRSGSARLVEAANGAKGAANLKTFDDGDAVR